MATAGGSFADIRTQAMTARSAAQDHSSKCRFPRSALQTSPYDVRKSTKISTTCTYCREILTFSLLFSTYRHALTSGLYPAHFWAYARTRTPAHVFPAHMHAHTFPRPVDSSANLLLLFMSISLLVVISLCFLLYVFESWQIPCDWKLQKFWPCGFYGVVVLLNIMYYWVYVLLRNGQTGFE